MAVCVVCGKSFGASRSDAQTCSDKCRAKLYRERRKIRKDIEDKQIDTEQWAELQQLTRYTPDAGELLKKLMALYGRDAYEIAIEAIRIVHDAKDQELQQAKKYRMQR